MRSTVSARLLWSAALFCLLCIASPLLVGYTPPAPLEEFRTQLGQLLMFQDASGYPLYYRAAEGYSVAGLPSANIVTSEGAEPQLHYAADHCDYSPGYMFMDIQRLVFVAAKAEYEKKGVNTNDMRADSLAYSYVGTLTGTTLLKGVRPLLNGSWGPQRFLALNGPALKAAFLKLYRKPQEKLLGYTYQQLYNSAWKNYVREIAHFTAKVLANKALLTKLTAEYKTRMETDKDFYGPNVTVELMNQVMGETWDDTADDIHFGISKEYPCLGWSTCRLLGSIVRRNIDGSLPQVLEALTTVLQDYDPQYHAQYSAKLRL